MKREIIMDNIVHYIHYNKLWYYWIDNSNKKKYWRKLEENDSIQLLTHNLITEKQCREMLVERFPTMVIMKAIPYHYSPSHIGSRPVKHTRNRKQELKEKKNFIQEITNE